MLDSNAKTQTYCIGIVIITIDSAWLTSDNINIGLDHGDRVPKSSTWSIASLFVDLDPFKLHVSAI